MVSILQCLYKIAPTSTNSWTTTTTYLGHLILGVEVEIFFLSIQFLDSNNHCVTLSLISYENHV